MKLQNEAILNLKQYCMDFYMLMYSNCFDWKFVLIQFAVQIETF